MSEPDWMLVDAQQRAATCPYTFCTPSAGVLGRLAAGDAVGLWLRARGEGDDGDHEVPGPLTCDWVVIVSRDDSSFVGTLDTSPDPSLGLLWGMEIAFRIEHVVETSLDDPVASPIEPFLPLCLADDTIIAGEAPVLEVFRETPIDEVDSGWRIGAGRRDETRSGPFPARTFVPLGKVLERDDSFVHLLHKPTGYRGRRVRTGPFEPVGEGIF